MMKSDHSQGKAKQHRSTFSPCISKPKKVLNHLRERTASYAANLTHDRVDLDLTSCMWMIYASYGFYHLDDQPHCSSKDINLFRNFQNFKQVENW
jgi:hypothetical protein